MEQELRMKDAEIARLKAGDFTPEEFQNLCHKFSEKDKEAFCKGCEDYQTKLFGESPITALRRERDELQRGLKALIQTFSGHG